MLNKIKKFIRKITCNHEYEEYGQITACFRNKKKDTVRMGTKHYLMCDKCKDKKIIFFEGEGFNC